METLLSRKQVAQMLNVSVMTIRRREGTGDLATIRLGPKLVRFYPAEIEAYKNANSFRRRG